MLELKRVTIGYGEPLIEEGSALLEAGTLVAILGRNGSGKSTLLKHIAGAMVPMAGEVYINGKTVQCYTAKERAKLISIVNTTRITHTHLTAYEVVTIGRTPYTNSLGRLTRQDHTIAQQALADIGMSHFAHRYMSQMSDGEKQRIMIARALAQDTPIILLDEPTAFLDLPNRYELTLMLQNLARKRGKLILFSTHELDIALQLTDVIMLIDTPRLIALKREEMRYSGHIEQLFRSSNVRFDPIEARVIIEGQ